ncbi:MAG: cytochrome c [Acidobacteriota bacterium]|nr:cytochrome c [Acidobacteriota bacterium]
MSTLRRVFRALMVALAVVAVAALGWAVVSLRADRPVTYDDIEDHFKYGSIGSEPGGSVLAPIGGVLPPYWVFTSLPSICSDRLPGGYATFGFVIEPGKDLPVGVSRRRRLGVDQVGLNCAVCHTGTVRDAPGAAQRIVLGMPAQQLDLQGFVQFVLDCTLDNRLTADAIAGRLPRAGGPSLFERALLGAGLIDRLKLQTLDLRNRMGPILASELPRWGRGRVDTFNPYKAIQFNWNLRMLPAHELIGAADLPSLWNQRPREGMHLHWDGDNDSVDERNLSAALGAGVTPVTVDHDNLKRVRDWIWTLRPPPYPYPVDRALAERGAGLYQTHCLECHADHRFRDGVTAGARVGLVEPIDRIATDRHRLDSYTFAFAANQYGLYPDSEYRFTHFRKTNGYANHPLDGIWLRGPYLHNGSVPTLRDLLDPPEQRPAVFYRGHDVFDQAGVGFVSNVEAFNGQVFTRFDTTVPGNGNGGHLYGTTLADEDKRAIVEYLKTF